MTTFDELFAEHNLTPKERKALVMHLATLRAQKTVQALQDCPHAAPHRYCGTCPVSPCPIGLGKNSNPERTNKENLSHGHSHNDTGGATGRA